MGINIDPESLKSLAEDVDLNVSKVIADLKKANASLLSQINDIKNTPDSKVADIVNFGWIDGRGGYSPVSSTLGHSLGVVPSKYMVSVSSAGVDYTTSVSVTNLTSTTVTVSVPAGCAAGGVFVLLLK